MTAWTDEQLAAFASGDLDDATAADLATTLRHDDDLATRLARIRAVDALLGSLPTPTPSDAFSARLRAATDEAVAEVVTGAAPGDELAARRARRDGSTWTRWAAVGAAAALAVVAGTAVVTGFNGFGSSDDMAAVEESALEARMAEDGADDAAAGMAMEAAPAFGPQLVALDEGLDDATLADLAANALARTGAVEAESAAELAAANRAAFLGDGGGTTAAQDPSQDDVSADSGPAPTGGTDLLQVVGQVTPEQVQQVGTCLAEVLGASEELDQTVIPLEAHVGTRDGEDVIAYLLLSRDATTQQFDRLETWVTTADACEVRVFTQS